MRGSLSLRFSNFGFTGFIMLLLPRNIVYNYSNQPNLPAPSACGILVLPPRIEPTPSAVKPQSPTGLSRIPSNQPILVLQNQISKLQREGYLLYLSNSQSILT